MTFAEVPFSLSPASHLTHSSQHSGRHVLHLQEHVEVANNSVNALYYEKMFKSTQFYDDVDFRCDSGSFSFVVGGNSEKNLFWQANGSDIVLHEMDLKSKSSCASTLVIKSPDNSFFLPGTSIKQTSSGIVIWLLSSSRTLYHLHIKKNDNTNNLIEELLIDNNLYVDSFKIGTSDQEIEGSYNRLQQKSIFNGLFGNNHDGNNIEFFKSYSEHFPTCMCAIDSQAVIVGLANGNLIRIIRDKSNFIHNTFVFETASWNWFSKKSAETNLEQVFKNLTVSVQHLGLYENQLNIIASLHRDGTLLVWKEDSDTSVSIGGETLPANNLKLLKINLQGNEIDSDSIKFCPLPLKINRGKNDSTFQIITSSSQNDQTFFTVFGFQTIIEERAFAITYNGVENTKRFSSELLPYDIFPVQREQKHLSSKLVSYSLSNGTVWSIWSVRDYSPHNVEECGYTSTLSYAIAYGSLLNDSCQPSAWCFVRTLHSQLSGGVSKFYGNSFGDTKYIGSYVEQFLFASTVRLLLNPNLLLRSLVSFYPKEKLHSLTQELGIAEDKPQIPYSHVNESFWSEKIKYAMEYSISQKRAKIKIPDILERGIQETKIEIQTWQEFLQNIVQIWSTFNRPTSFFFMNNQSTPSLLYTQPIASVLRTVDTLEFTNQSANQAPNGNRNYQIIAKNLPTKDQVICKRSTFAKDLVEFFGILNFIEKSASELLSIFTVLPFYFSQTPTLENPAVVAKKIAVELVSGLSDHDNISDTLVKDFRQNSQKKLFVNNLLNRISTIRNTPLPSILNFIVRTLVVTESPCASSRDSDSIDLISMENPLLVRLINVSSMQILEARYQLICQLCVFIEISSLLTPLQFNGETKNYYSLLRSYHLAWWLSNRNVESNPQTLNLVTSLSVSKLNLADYLLTHPSPTSDSRCAIELILRESNVAGKLLLWIPHLDHSSLSTLINNISMIFIQQFFIVEYESITSQSNAIEIAQYLLNWQAHSTLKRYCLLLQSYDSSFPLSYHFLALANLQEGDLLQAKNNFLKCAIVGISNRERNTESLRLFELMNIYWKVEPTVLDNQQNVTLVKSSLLFYYYNYIRQLCEKHPELALEFSNLALTEADSDTIPPEEISILYSALFSLSLHYERFDMAYIALSSQNDVQRKKSDLRKFVGTICDLASYNSDQCKYFGNMLCELPFSGSRNEVNDLLHERAKYADISIKLANVGTSHVKVLYPNGSRSGNYTLLEEHKQKLNTVFTYYHLLYSYNVHRGDYNKAAMYIYELGRRIDNQIRIVPFSATSNDSHEEVVEAYLQKQTECFLIALNSLKIVLPSNQWFLYPYDDAQPIERAVSPLKRARDDQIQVEQDSSYTKPGVITLANLEKRYHLSASKLLVLQVQKKTPSPSFNILALVLLTNPIDIISQFLSGSNETIEKAFMVASSCNLSISEMCVLFSKITKKCCESGDIHSGGVAKKMWSLLKMKLSKYNNSSTGYLFASSVVRTIYQELQCGFITKEDSFLPDWLIEQCDPNSLLRIYLEFGKIAEAQKLLLQKSLQFGSSPLLSIPISQTLVEYVAKQ